MQHNLLENIYKQKLIAIIRGVATKNMIATAEALLAGGMAIMEITFDHSSEAGMRESLNSIALLREKMGKSITLGAGTVLSAEQAKDAYSCGARFIISPDTRPAVIQKTKELGMLSMPGALTPSEITLAREAGADIVKLFPAGLWGLEYIRAIRAPLGHIPLSIVGGVTPENIRSFLDAGICCAGIGNSLVSAAKVSEKKFSEISEAARRFRKNLNSL